MSRFIPQMIFAVAAVMTLIPTPARAQNIHADCLKSPYPRLCTEMVNELLEELGEFNQAFNPPNIDKAAAYYHERATLYTAATGQFYIGRDAIRNTYFAPLFGNVSKASVDFSTFHFSVISPNVIVAYGRLPATIVLTNGMVLTQPPLPQTLTFIRNEVFDPKRPFLVISDQE